MSTTATLGYPRIGKQRELKYSLEKYWAGKIQADELQRTARDIRFDNWSIQKSAGIDFIPCNDFSLYDQMLDTSWMVRAIPERFKTISGEINELDLFFAMARGWQKGQQQIAAMEMTKWFDTNYHYLVPEITPDQTFSLNDQKVIHEILEAKEIGLNPRPVIIGPVTYLMLSKSSEKEYSPLQVLNRLIPVYEELLRHIASTGVEWVQVDEPCLVLNLTKKERDAYRFAYNLLANVAGIKIMLTTYFGKLGDNLQLVTELPVAGVHIDLIRAPQQLLSVLQTISPEQVLSLGLVDGRNVWRTDLAAAAEIIHKALASRKSEKLQISSSCSLLFCPQDLDLEEDLDVNIKSWLSFGKQKLDEINVLKALANGEEEIFQEKLQKYLLSRNDRLVSVKVNDCNVQERLKQVRPEDYFRHSPYPQRKLLQAKILKLPLLPTTTIGSFPQTAEVRKQRAQFGQGKITQHEYDEFVKEKTSQVIQLQESLGLDVLVHGEFERTDMVEYFARQMKGFAFTKHAWVQSYGSRAVRPPIIYGDVSRKKSMTVDETCFAQSLTKKPLKGMITGPITILQWSFVRDDQPRSQTCSEIALALRDEVYDLETNGIKIIQIDEPALREGLPLRKEDQADYLNWAVDCFRLAAGVAKDETQIHTHMCYCEFNNIMDAIIRMDADVISIEASRSRMELLDAFKQIEYPNEIGPGIYDIHSPRIPTEDELVALIEKALWVIPAERLWINPDCGLKTRGWDEVVPSLTHLVSAARRIRLKLNKV